MEKPGVSKEPRSTLHFPGSGVQLSQKQDGPLGRTWAMSASAAPVTPSGSRGPALAKPAAPPRHSGTDEAALTELRNACATYDYLRRKGDPAQFWEMLRLARSRRALLAPPEGEAPAPAPDVEAGIVDELDAMR